MKGIWYWIIVCGSGSSGVACKNLNRNFIGIEKNEEYFKIANDRLFDMTDMFFE